MGSKLFIYVHFIGEHSCPSYIYNIYIVWGARCRFMDPGEVSLAWSAMEAEVMTSQSSSTRLVSCEHIFTESQKPWNFKRNKKQETKKQETKKKYGERVCHGRLFLPPFVWLQRKIWRLELLQGLCSILVTGHQFMASRCSLSQGRSASNGSMP